MADAAQETDSAILLIRDALVRLRAAYPGHELLQFADNYAYMELPAEFRERFGRARVAECFRHTEFAVAATYMNYYEDIRKVLGEHD